MENNDAASSAPPGAGDVKEKAQKTLQQQAEQRAKQAGEQVSGTAEDLRSVGEELRKQGKDGPAKIADRAAEQTTTLVRKEIELAKAELSAKGKVAGEGAGMFGGAAVAGLLALGTLTALILSLLDKAMDFSLAALLVTLAYAAVGGFLALNGRERIKRGMPAAPEQTVETVKEDVQWAKSQARSARR